MHIGWNRARALRTAALAMVLATPTLPALAATQSTPQQNTTQSDVNVLNLLSPFLGLDATTTGQATLTANLNRALATNALAASSPTIEAVSISDKTIFSGNSTAITLAGGASSSYGPGANLGGGLPVQAVQSTGGIAPYQQYGGLGALGPAFQAAVSPTGAAAPALVTLLNAAYGFTSTDLGVAKYYFANGTYNGTVTAVAPSGSSLPTYNGLPNTTNSVYDLAYGVINTGANQDIYGDSRPVQVDGSAVKGYDPTALTGLATNPSFPSGHTTYAFTDSILIGMLEPQDYQAMLLRASEYGNSRISLGVHYPLDIIASRSFVSYDLAQLLNGAAGYTTTNAVGSAAALNLSSLFTAAQPQLTAALGGAAAVSTAAASNPYNAYSLATYGAQGATNSAIYDFRMNYGLPTLSFAAAPQEQAPAGGPDASILLATIYGGSTAAAQALAPTGGLYGDLTTATINQIIVNTETNALAAFYGTSLSYWSRLDLYDAIGYFSNLTNTLTLASSDQVLTNVTVANTGVLSGSGTIGTSAARNSVEVRAGGVLYPGARGETSGGVLTVNGAVKFDAGSQFEATGLLTAGVLSSDSLKVNGALTLASGSQLNLNGLYLPGAPITLIAVSGGSITGTFSSASLVGAGNLMSLVTPNVQYGASFVSVLPQAAFVTAAATPNEAAVATAIDAAANGGGYGANGASLLEQLITNNTTATAAGAFDALSGEGLTGLIQASFDSASLFANTVMTQTITGGAAAPGMTIGGTHVWASGLGQWFKLDGQASNGSAGLTSNDQGLAAGVDFLAGSGLRLGFTAGASFGGFNVAGRDTTGTVNTEDLGVYGRKTYGPLYVAGNLDFIFTSNKTNRYVSGVGPTETETSSSHGNEVLGRIEAGYGYRMSQLNVSPFIAYQGASLQVPGFSETSAGGSGVLALNVTGRHVPSDETLLGVQLDTNMVLGEGRALTPYARLSWAHQFDTERDLTVQLQSLPANFTVQGAPASANAALLDVGAKLAMSRGVTAYAAFDGGAGNHGESYAGTGGITIAW
jgi:outer membrane autotransporter protein